MNDTPPEVEERLRELYAQRTPGERVEMASRMYDAGVELMKAGIRHYHPDISDEEMKWEVFMRLHGDCYSEEELKKIRAFLCPTLP